VLEPGFASPLGPAGTSARSAPPWAPVPGAGGFKLSKKAGRATQYKQSGPNGRPRSPRTWHTPNLGFYPRLHHRESKKRSHIPEECAPGCTRKTSVDVPAQYTDGGAPPGGPAEQFVSGSLGLKGGWRWQYGTPDQKVGHPTPTSLRCWRDHLRSFSLNTFDGGRGSSVQKIATMEGLSLAGARSRVETGR